MLTPFDDFPVHQTPLPIAQTMNGHPDFYDRFWFNGFRDDAYFAVALGVYPNRDTIDAAFSVVSDGVQRSVFASGRMPADRTDLRVGPIRIEVLEPFRTSRVVVDGAEHGLQADMVFRARTRVVEESRQVRYQQNRLAMDVTRGTQFGAWSGAVSVEGAPLLAAGAEMLGVKDRSWGIRPVGQPTPAAPARQLPQIFFLWAPLHFADRALHALVFEDGSGSRWSEAKFELPVIGDHDPTWGPDAGSEEFASFGHSVRWAEGLRRSNGATLRFGRRSGATETVELEPLLTFRMRGAGYGHPKWSHGTWQGEEAVGAERHRVEELDNLEPFNIHVQQVVRARWEGRDGIGVLEQIAIGPHEPSGFADLLDGARPGATSG